MKQEVKFTSSFDLMFFLNSRLFYGILHGVLEVLKVKPLKEDVSRRRFLLSQRISEWEKLYESKAQASISPIASKIFGFAWTQSVRVGCDFVEISKQDWVNWEVLQEPLTQLIQEHFENLPTPIEENPKPKTKGEVQGERPWDSPLGQKIQSFINSDINPYLAAHGGSLELISLDNHRVFVEMKGGCQGCAQSTQTLKEGVSRSLQSTFPMIKEVVDITDHSKGTRPFY